MGKKQRDDKDTKERILLSAKKEFSQKGFHGARMEQIAKDANVNKALIHYYFENKESLYKEIVTRAFGLGERRDIAIYTEKWDLTPSQKLYVLFYFMVNLTTTVDRDRYRILFWEIVEGINYHEDGIKEFIIPIHKIMMNIIDEGIKTGEFTIFDPKLLTVFILFSIFHYNLDKEIFGNSPTFKELYGNKNDQEVFSALTTIMFKALSPESKETTIPEVPKEIQSFMDNLIKEANVAESEGYAQGILSKISDILSS